MSSVPADYP
jgi:predicted nuclease of restriction endonuclease-like (RecB) superfamily